MRIQNSFALISLLLLLAACGGNQTPQPEANSGREAIDPKLRALDDLIKKEPSNPNYRFMRAQYFYDAEAFDEAIDDLRQALLLDSLQPAYYHLMADALLDYARPNDSKRAIQILEQAASLFPDDPLTLLKLSEFNLIVRQHNNALAALDQLLRQDPQNAEAFFMSGRVALDMGDTTRAIKAFQKSVQYDADLFDAWVFIGRIFAKKNNPLALQYFDNALRLDTANLQVMEYKAGFFLNRREYGKARDMYRKIILADPDYSNAYYDLGIMYLNQDSLQQAYDHFGMAVKTDPLYIRAYYMRGIAAERKGDLDAALRDFTQASRMNANFEEAAEARDRVARRLKKK